MFGLCVQGQLINRTPAGNWGEEGDLVVVSLVS